MLQWDFGKEWNFLVFFTHSCITKVDFWPIFLILTFTSHMYYIITVRSIWQISLQLPSFLLSYSPSAISHTRWLQSDSSLSLPHIESWSLITAAPIGQLALCNVLAGANHSRDHQDRLPETIFRLLRWWLWLFFGLFQVASCFPPLRGPPKVHRPHTADPERRHRGRVESASG